LFAVLLHASSADRDFHLIRAVTRLLLLMCEMCEVMMISCSCMMHVWRICPMYVPHCWSTSLLWLNNLQYSAFISAFSKFNAVGWMTDQAHRLVLLQVFPRYLLLGSWPVLSYKLTIKAKSVCQEHLSSMFQVMPQDVAAVTA